ncbi:MAG: hypothetical protein IPJ88_17095 [Myxococcales bacterium]|nr:MAG: hypothetical protein IPJ88_17095 [Myxococcales bacterium]
MVQIRSNAGRGQGKHENTHIIYLYEANDPLATVELNYALRRPEELDAYLQP